MATMEWAAAWVHAEAPGRGDAGTRGRGEGFFYDGVAAGREVRAGLSRRSAATRPLPMEDLCFFVKPIDNSRLVRVLDPHSRSECLKLVAVVSAVFFLALLYILPYLSLLRAGYRVEDLKKDHETLAEAGRQLKIKEAELRDPHRIAAIARGNLGMLEAAPEQVVWPEASGSQPGAGELIAHDLSRRGEGAK